MVDRNILQVNDTLYERRLVLHPAENQAAKIFAEWLKDHPEYSPSEVDMRIDCYEVEEDHYGNGGGYDKFVRIYKTRKETTEEHDARVKREEDESFVKFNKEVRNCVVDLIHDLDLYPNYYSQDIDNKADKVIELTMKVVRKQLRQNAGSPQPASR